MKYKVLVLLLSASVFSSLLSFASKTLADDRGRWLKGISELRLRAAEDEREHSGFYFSTENRKNFRSVWTPWDVGETLKVLPDFPRAGKVFDSLMRSHPSKITICLLHTHPRKLNITIRKLAHDELVSRHLLGLEKLDGPGVIAVPPGYSDISVDFDLNDAVSEKGSQTKLHQSLGVVDSLGIWYYSLIKSERERMAWLQANRISSTEYGAFVRKNSSRDLNEFRVPFMIEANLKQWSGSDILYQASYRQLILKYAQEDTRLRFVPFTHLTEELPCKGPN